MTLGKTDGKSFSFSFLIGYGFSFFIPYGDGCLSMGFNWRLANTKGFKPNVSFFHISNSRPFARMYHLRYPYNVIKIGTWK